MIRAIIFDCFGVLTADTWKEFVFQLPPSQRSAASALNHAYDAGHLTREEFVQSVQELTRRTPDDINDLLDNEVTKNHLLLNYIAGLKPTYKIGLLSNVATNWIRDSFLDRQEQKLFDAMVLSFETGLTKPDPRMFRLMSEKLGAQPEECLMVDDIEHYCQVAVELGMKSVVYENFEQARQAIQTILNDTKE